MDESGARVTLIGEGFRREFSDFEDDIDPGMQWGSGQPVLFRVLFPDQPPGVVFLSNRPLEEGGVSTGEMQFHPDTLHYNHTDSVVIGPGVCRVFDAINPESAGGLNLFTLERGLINLTVRLVLSSKNL